MEVLLTSLGSVLLAAGAIAVAVVVHAIGLGRIPPSPVLGLPGRRLRADARTYRASHRAATALTWLAASVAGVAALGALAAAAGGGVREWAVLEVLAAVVLVVGLALATWRAHSALDDDPLRP